MGGVPDLEQSVVFVNSDETGVKLRSAPTSPSRQGSFVARITTISGFQKMTMWPICGSWRLGDPILIQECETGARKPAAGARESSGAM